MTDTPIALAKSELRAELRRRRRALSPRFRRQAALAVARHARRWLRPGHTLAAYLTSGSELHSDRLILNHHRDLTTEILCDKTT